MQAGKQQDGSFGFYAFAPEGKAFRVFFETRRGPNGKTSTLTETTLRTFAQAERFVGDLNAKAVRQ